MSRSGRLKVEGEQVTLTFDRLLPCSPEVVWTAITEPGELSNWYMAAKVEGRVGGSVDFSSESAKVTGIITVWDPPRVFEHEWRVERSGSPIAQFGVVRWELAREGNSTRLKLIHRDLPRQFARNFAPGAHALVDRLEKYLENEDLPDWRKQVQELQADYSQNSS